MIYRQAISIIDTSKLFENIDIDMTILKNIDMDKAILEHIDININKDILENIYVDKIAN